MVFEASTLDLCFPFFHAEVELPVLPFGCFMKFSIPLPVVPSLRCFVQLLFMFFWREFTFIDNEPCRTPFRFFPWTNLSGVKLKLEWPFSGLPLEDQPSLERSLVLLEFRQ